MELLLVLELISVVLNILFLILLTKENKNCWLFGIVGSIIGAYIFYKTQLYSESILYLFYTAMGVYGYFVWSKKRNNAFQIKSVSLIHSIKWVFVASGFAIVLGYLMSKTNADKTYYDAFSTSFGIVATFLEIYKYLVAWYFWIAVNIFSIWLYGTKSLNFFAIQMIIYTALSIYGAYKWHKKLAV